MDRYPPGRDVPAELVQLLRDRSDEFGAKWDEMYPENPVSSSEVNDD